MAAAKAAAAKDSAPPAPFNPTIEALRLIRGGVHVEGSLTQLLRSTGSGVHNGWTFTEDERGVVATKAGQKSFRFPWSQIQQLEYAAEDA